MKKIGKEQGEPEALGLKFLRFDDIEIKRNLNSVVVVIEEWIKRNANRRE